MTMEEQCCTYKHTYTYIRTNVDLFRCCTPHPRCETDIKRLPFKWTFSLDLFQHLYFSFLISHLHYGTSIQFFSPSHCTCRQVSTWIWSKESWRSPSHYSFSTGTIYCRQNLAKHITSFDWIQRLPTTSTFWDCWRILYLIFIMGRFFREAFSSHERFVGDMACQQNIQGACW